MNDVHDPQVRAIARLVPGPVVRRESRHRPGLRWIETGAGDPVVLVAGAGEVCLDWVTVLPALAARHRALAYDRAGLGASDSFGPVTLHAQLDDLVSVTEEAGPATLVGHSWGGLLAELVTLGRPGLVTGLVLVDPFREGTSADVSWRLRAASRLSLAGLVPLQMVGLFPRMAAGMGRALAEQCTSDPATRQAMVEAYVASYNTVGQVARIGAENRLGDHCTAEVRAIRAVSTPPDVPLRILTADRGKPAGLQRRYDVLAGRMAREWPHGEHVVVPDSGHYIHHDRPEAVAAAVATVRQARPPQR